MEINVYGNQSIVPDSQTQTQTEKSENSIEEPKQTPTNNLENPVTTEEGYDANDIVYSRDEITNTNTTASIQEQMLVNLNSCGELEAMPIDGTLGNEIYAFSIYDGKVHVQGQPGFEAKAQAYEKLLNASLKSQFQWKWGNQPVDESIVIDSLTDMFHYYSSYDQQISKENPKDSIANHVGEAFDKWYQDNKPQRGSFLASV